MGTFAPHLEHMCECGHLSQWHISATLFKKGATVYGELYETSTHCEFSVVARLTACLTVERRFFEG
jgi:hypothetical protein